VVNINKLQNVTILNFKNYYVYKCGWFPLVALNTNKACWLLPTRA